MQGSSRGWTCRNADVVPGSLPGADRVGYSSRGATGLSAYRLPAAPPPRRPEPAPGASLSVIRPKPPEEPIGYDPGATTGGLSAAPAARLDAIREALGAADAPPGRPAPATAACIDLPDRLLADYGRERPASELFAILRAARRIRDTVDRVIVLGGAGSVLATRAVFESCCHPFHNELSRGERGGRPRLSFAGFALDNDSVQGLLDLVAPPGRPRGSDLLDRWALIVVDGDGRARETTLVTRLFLAALAESVGGDRQLLAELVVPITAAESGRADPARVPGCVDGFAIPAGIDPGFSPFTAASLLPAAVVGMDVVRLLQGAAAMNRRFREAPLGSNPVLDFAAARHGDHEAGAPAHVFCSPTDRLESLGCWYARLRADRLGREVRVATPLRAALSSSGEERGGTGADGARIPVTRLVVGEPRRDPLVLPALPFLGHDEDGLDALVGTAWPALQAGAAPAWRGAEIVLPRVDEHAIGQLLQMLMLSTVVEGGLGV